MAEVGLTISVLRVAPHQAMGPLDFEGAAMGPEGLPDTEDLHLRTLGDHQEGLLDSDQEVPRRDLIQTGDLQWDHQGCMGHPIT